MTADKMLEYFAEHKKFPSLEEMHDEPIGWFPTHPRNPSKLIAHKFVNGEWIAMCHAKFVAWPEAFPDDINWPKHLKN